MGQNCFGKTIKRDEAISCTEEKKGLTTERLVGKFKKVAKQNHVEEMEKLKAKSKAG